MLLNFALNGNFRTRIDLIEVILNVLTLNSHFDRKLHFAKNHGINLFNTRFNIFHLPHGWTSNLKIGVRDENERVASRITFVNFLTEL